MEKPTNEEIAKALKVHKLTRESKDTVLQAALRVADSYNGIGNYIIFL